MPRPREYFTKGDALTTDFTYIRWLGDRKAIEELTKLWDKTIIDRSEDLREWIEACRSFMQRKIECSPSPITTMAVTRQTRFDSLKGCSPNNFRPRFTG